MMSVLTTIVIGFLIGLLARFVMPGPNPAGMLMTTLLGIGGSLLATYLGQWLGWYQPGQAAGFIMSVVGAVLLLAIYGFLRKKTA